MCGNQYCKSKRVVGSVPCKKNAAGGLSRYSERVVCRVLVIKEPAVSQHDPFAEQKLVGRHERASAASDPRKELALIYAVRPMSYAEAIRSILSRSSRRRAVFFSRATRSALIYSRAIRSARSYLFSFLCNSAFINFITLRSYKINIVSIFYNSRLLKDAALFP